MKPVITMMIGTTAAWLVAAGAQEPQPPEQQAQAPEQQAQTPEQQAQAPEQQGQAPEQQAQQGIPATQHQRETLRELDSELLGRLDADQDGSISREEAQTESALIEGWSEYDLNGDQVLDQHELAAYEAESESEDIEVAEGERTVEGLPATQHQREAVGQQLVEQLDTDGDGAISQSEAQGSSELTADWEELDRNDDGKLDVSELDGAEQGQH